MDDFRVYGVPGAGKTTAAINWTLNCVDQCDVDPLRVIFCSFTRTACFEASSRLAQAYQDRGINIYDYELEEGNVRTLHSLALRSLNLDRNDWNADAKLHAFAKEYDYQIGHSKVVMDTTDVDQMAETSASDRPYLDIYAWGRNRLLRDPQAAWRAFQRYDSWSTSRLDVRRYLKLVKDYQKWKTDNELLDYTDLLEMVAEHGQPIKFSSRIGMGVVDEAQDLSRLQWEVADRLLGECQIRATFGDDDQAIYTFQGSDPVLFNSRPATDIQFLNQSYRLPRLIAERAMRIIRRSRTREDKEIIPRSEDGEVFKANSIQQIDFSLETMLLCRNWAHIPELADALEEMGVVYAIKGGYYSTPWDNHRPYRAAKAMITLSAGGEIVADDVEALIAMSSTEKGDTPGLWVHGAKARVNALLKNQQVRPVNWQGLAGLGVTTSGLQGLMRRDFSVLSGIKSRNVDAYQTALRNGTFGTEPHVILGTIHSVKGGEADQVVCLEACTAAPANNLVQPNRRDEEYRVAYVGITRAKQRFGTLAASAVSLPGTREYSVW